MSIIIYHGTPDARNNSRRGLLGRQSNSNELERQRRNEVMHDNRQGEASQRKTNTKEDKARDMTRQDHIQSQQKIGMGARSK